ncbi:PREDICTED: olfactory receptor 9A4 [Myotis davidii]|uniref:olfactory receptor 9A4 n=1 Tax=Myotis davidii TaxID=225400 RepID=UPI0003EBE21E|nr:PREDICTED: olfactory receptor 9A4 [Myotis davidii]
MMSNHTSATEFCLLGFPGSEELHHILFATFFLFYSVTLMGNTVIIVIVCVDKRLQSPMYFFLGHLSALEILTTSIIIPVMLRGFLLPGMQTISLAGCVAQLFLYLAVGTTEFALLGVMAVDRYVAVCNPLRYNIIMNSHTCIWVVIVSWVFGFLSEIWPVYATFQLTFHFTFVVIGYGSCLFLYVKPNQRQAAQYNKIVSLLISVVTPFLNPFIFTLRNDKVKEALRDSVKHCYQLFKD